MDVLRSSDNDERQHIPDGGWRMIGLYRVDHHHRPTLFQTTGEYNILSCIQHHMIPNMVVPDLMAIGLISRAAYNSGHPSSNMGFIYIS